MLTLSLAGPVRATSHIIDYDSTKVIADIKPRTERNIGETKEAEGEPVSTNNVKSRPERKDKQNIKIKSRY